MNIFKDKENLIGKAEAFVSHDSLRSLFQLAAEIRGKLGNKGYLLDNYLSCFFCAVDSTPTIEVAENGWQSAADLWALCDSVVKHTDNMSDHPLYSAAITLNQAIGSLHQEADTCSQLIFAALFDQFVLNAADSFLKKSQTRLLEEDFESLAMDQLYADIKTRIGEPLLESLNLQLKQRFLIVPITAAFIQSLTDNLVSSFVSRDPESSRQIFQLLMDGSSGVEARP